MAWGLVTPDTNSPAIDRSCDAASDDHHLGRTAGQLGHACIDLCAGTRSLTTNHRTMKATPQDVWDVLSEGWLYPLWVVGASRMREVDDHWPQPGARLHHSVGSWPLLVDDATEVARRVTGLVARPPREGATDRHRQGDHPDRSRGAGDTRRDRGGRDSRDRRGLIPKVVRDLPLAWRNVETLRRLAYVVERRSARTPRSRD